MVEALSRLEIASFNDWLDASGLARSYFNDLLKELIEQQEVVNICPKGKHPLYSLQKISSWVLLMHLSTSFLFELLEKVRTSDNKEGATSEFNRYFGSLIAYILKNYSTSHAEEIFQSILPQVGSYLNYPKTFMGQPVLKDEPNIESPEWSLWRDIDSRNYVTTVKVPRSPDALLVKRQKKAQTQSELPCSGRCICDKVSNGCGNRLIEAKLKNRSAMGAIRDIGVKKNQNRDVIVEIEAIDSAKFYKKWLSGEKPVA